VSEVHGEESLLLFPLGLSVDELFPLFMERLSSKPGSSTTNIKDRTGDFYDNTENL
jgi:hypothetical protein